MAELRCCGWVRLLPLAVLLAIIFPVRAESLLDGGHIKGQWQSATYPEDSLYRDLLGANSSHRGLDIRLRLEGRRQRFGFNLDYQLQGQFGDSLAGFGETALFSPSLSERSEDSRRWWDLSAEIDEGNNHRLVQRLDRLSLDYRGDKLVARFGRQAISWGNGLIFNPLDVFNPFDPTAVDTEYKRGDDMLYLQYLLDNGSDWQFVSVARRDDAGELSSAVVSHALKYHHFGELREFDLLIASHYDETLLGVGSSGSIGGAVFRGDVSLVDTESGWIASAVANGSYSFTVAGYNTSAVVEYFFSGVGLHEEDYHPLRLAREQELLARLERRELYNIGRHYLAGSLMVEVTPLISVTPTLFTNLGDGSALLQLSASWDPAQEWRMLAALNLPLGPAGTEFGGIGVIDSQLPGRTLATGPALFVQLAWYF